jgi:dimethylsulfone monooxygenase
MSHGAPHTHPIFSSNRLKLATFCTNAAPFLVRNPDAYEPSWERCRRAAVLADQGGFEGVVPLARWKGFLNNEPDHISHRVLDPFVFAAGVAMVTEHVGVFSTVQVASMHPIVVAKQATTIDQMSGGRFALNVVAGWNRMDNEMLGMPVLEHTVRYEYAEQWLAAVRRLWGEPGEVDADDGEYVKMRGGVSRPQPLRGAAVPIMNAGLSDTGARFAAGHADIALINLTADDPEVVRADVERYRRIAREEGGRDIQVWTNAVVLQREQQAAAEDELDRFMAEDLDEEGLAAFMAMIGAQTSVSEGTEAFDMMRKRVAYGGGYLLLGDATAIADKLEMLARCGVDGVLLVWADPIDGLERFNEVVLPELVRRELRAL